MRRAAVAIVLAGATACSFNLDGFTSNAPDGGVASDAGGLETSAPPDGDTPPPFIDGGGDATVAPPAVGGGVVVAQGVSKYAAGAAQKHHVVFAQNLGAWLVFYESATETDRILAKVTKDFVTFADAPPLMLERPHDNDGRNFDVAYGNIAGADIFYVAYSTHQNNGYNYVIRGRMQAGTLTWSAAISTGEADTTDTTLDPDAPAMLLLANGTAFAGSGYNTVNAYYANFVVFTATKPDDGSANFTPVFDSGKGIEIDPLAVNARTIIAAPFGAVGIWERADSEPDPKDMGFTTFQSASWGAASSVGFTQDKYDVNDWDAVTTDDGMVHVVRWTSGAYAHRLVEQTNTAAAGYSVPAAPHSPGDGLVILDVAGTATMLDLGTDFMLRRTTLSGATWAPWTPIGAADTTRHHLSGGAYGGSAIVLWEITNPTGSTDLGAMKLP